MRIISGKFKGRRIKYDNLQNVKPTTDKTKESLFNILNQYFVFEKISALDLFSGSGNISYELVSRGVTRVTTVEKSFQCVKFINNYAKKIDIKLNVFNCDVFQFLKATKSKFNHIIADPPYTHSSEEIKYLIDLVFNKKILKKNGMLIIEHHKKKVFSDNEFLFDVRTYGISSLSFFKKCRP